jgi:hypothetical protein
MGLGEGGGTQNVRIWERETLGRFVASSERPAGARRVCIDLQGSAGNGDFVPQAAVEVEVVATCLARGAVADVGVEGMSVVGGRADRRGA